MQAFELNVNELGQVPIKLIDPDPEQPRKDFDEDYLNQLADSIKVDGVIQPIVVRTHPEEPGRFYLVAGENRWRASKLAKKLKIPAVLREVAGLNKLLIQLKENHQRKDLNPMEWAQAFRSMQKDHGLKQADIEKTLKDSGVGQFGRAYISNIMRLLDLPEWSQDLIRHNRLTAAHGKYLIPATASEKVIEVLQQKFEDINYAPTTRDLQRDVFWEFKRHHIDLTGYQTDFDYRKKCVATGCQKMRKASSEQGEGTFCLDKQCHAILQAEESNKDDDNDSSSVAGEYNGEAGEPRAIAVSEDNRVYVESQQLDFYRDWRSLERADFDLRGCAQCPHRHIAVDDDDSENATHTDACFLVSCYIAKEDQGKRSSRLLEGYITQKINTHVAEDPAMVTRLMAWAVASYPEGITQREDEEWIEHGQMLVDADYNGDDVDRILFKNQLFSLEKFIRADEHQFVELATYMVTEMGEPELLTLWKHYAFHIEHYRIDEAWLAEHTEDEIKAAFNIDDIPPVAFAELENAIKDGKLDKFALEHRDMLGVPNEIRYAWERFTKKATGADEEDDE